MPIICLTAQKIKNFSFLLTWVLYSSQIDSSKMETYNKYLYLVIFQSLAAYSQQISAILEPNCLSLKILIAKINLNL